jgi:CheY-like chemotaxis protein
LAKKAFQLMITDYNMPGLNGLELAPKALAIAPNMPIIMCTGAISAEIPRLAEAAGITSVLGKPFSPGKMLRLIKSVTGKP